MSIDKSRVLEYVFLNRNEYDSLTAEQKDRRRIFFIEDTGEMYKGSEIYSNSLVIVDQLPDNPAESKIYIHEGKLKRYINDGWENIELKPVTTDSISDESLDNIVTAKAVKLFIDNALKNYRSIDKIIFKTMAEALKYAENTALSKPGEIISVLFNGKYIAYIITAERGLKTISSDSLDLDVESTETIEMNITKAGIISANVNISEDADNAISVRGDGLYVKSEIPIEVI